MDGQVPQAGKEVPRLEIPEDVAVLYAWANLQGARYRDFSASRRELRAQVRQRAAQARQQSQALARAQAEDSAANAEKAAQEAAGVARFHEAQARKARGEHRPEVRELEQAARERALRQASELSRRAAEERKEAVRCAEVLRDAEEVVQREAREASEAHASVQRQTLRYETGMVSGEQSPEAALAPGRDALSDPYTQSRTMPVAPRPPGITAGRGDDMRPERFPRRRDVRSLAPPRKDAALEPARKPGEPPLLPALNPAPAAPDVYAPAISLSTQAADCRSEAANPPGEEDQALQPLLERRRSAGTASSRQGFRLPRPETKVAQRENVLPEWIHEQTTAPGQGAETPPLAHAPVANTVAYTLQQSRERVASRWFALRGIFDPGAPDMEPTQAHARAAEAPVVAIFSLAGGVGRTSLTASLGRALSAVGRKVLLVDVTPQEILPFYFGATELRPGVIRTFAPPEGSADAPVALLSYDLFGQNDALQEAGQALLQQLDQGKERFDYVIADLSPGAAPILRQLAQVGGAVLVPVAPDMNTVIALSSMERFFATIMDGAGRPVEPHYLLTQFEAALPLHLDVREVMREKLGHRLLPFVIRRSPAVAEALAEGMTAIDYAPEGEVAADYRHLASWVRMLARPAHHEARAARWSER